VAGAVASAAVRRLGLALFLVPTAQVVDLPDEPAGDRGAGDGDRAAAAVLSCPVAAAARQKR